MTEADYITACRESLRRAGHRNLAEVRLASGVWAVSGRDAEGLPFFAGHPEGRAASWHQACRLNGVQPPLPEDASEAEAPPG